MSSWTRFSLTVAGLVALIAVLVMVLVRRELYPPGGDLVVESRVVRPPPRRPVPSALDALHREILELEEKREFRTAADRRLLLITRLAGLWGDDDADLAPYYYDLADTLRLSGNLRDCEGFVIEARKKWPDDLPFRILDVSLRAEASIRNRRLDPTLESLFDGILTRDNHARLRGHGFPPEVLHAQRGAVLAELREFRAALEVVGAGLVVAPEHRVLRRLRARVLVEMGRGREAIPLLRELLAIEPSTELDYFLGVALFETGDPAAAHEKFSALLTALEKETDSDGRLTRLRSNIRYYSASSLVDLDRSSAAVDLLLQNLIETPYDVETLRTLEGALRQMGRDEAAAGMVRRMRELDRRQAFVRDAHGGLASGGNSSALFFQGLSELSVGRMHRGLERLRLAIAGSPRMIELHREYGRALESLGRRERAVEVYADGYEKTEAPVFLLEKARVTVALGRRDGVEKALEDPRLSLPESPTASGVDQGTLRRALERRIAQRLRVYLELGEHDAVRGFFRANSPDELLSSEILLVRAELALVDGERATTARVLERVSSARPHDVAWKRAMALLVEALESSATADENFPASRDPSDLLDHIRIIENAKVVRSLERRSAHLGRWARRIVEVGRERRALLDAIEASQDDEVESDAEKDGATQARWLELLTLYRRANAHRKARELAWYLLGGAPEDVEALLRLASVLLRPADLVEKLSVVETGLRVDPTHKELLELRASIRRSLGV